MILLEPTINPSHNEKSCKLQLSNGMHCNLCHGQIKDNIKRYSHLLLTTDPILIEYSKFTDGLLFKHLAGYCTSANALMLGAIFLFCFGISAWLIVLNPIVATY